MNIVQAEENLKKITAKFSKESFIFDLMWAYDFPKATISRLQKGSLDKAKNENEVVLKKKFYFISTSKKDLDSIFEKAIKDNSILKHDPRFIIVTDNQSLKAYDTKVGEKLDTEIKTLSKHPDFFLPWAGIEKKVFNVENPADVKAAEKLAKLFDLIRLDNTKFDEKNRHALNVFLTRVLFCFFAEDTDIFPKGLFTESIASHTNKDGSDLDNYLLKLFEVLNKKSRTGLPDYLKEFPYVNGGLFAEEYPIPKFSKRSRESLIDLGSDLNWAEINPDIFGSMIQAVVHPDQRAGLGMHYTSVTNIMKVIEPLFLSELREEFEKSISNKPKLKKLLERINNIKIFDPACGSGNFLIIAYKELRILEIKILKELGGFTVSAIPLSSFCGIEIDDFAHEVAKLSLWLAEHQMNVLFNKEFGNVKASLPLKDSGQIVCDNATRIDWNTICPKNGEVYILGNPPYLGGKKLNAVQSEDMDIAGLSDKKQLDYIACWFTKAFQYVKETDSTFSFVSTSSICQGEQVHLLWSDLDKLNLEIFFAYDPFKWSNNAKNNAGVYCTIIGVRNKIKKKEKYIFSGFQRKTVSNISPYLVEGENVIVEPESDPINNLPKMIMGSNPVDGLNLIVSQAEYHSLIKDYPQAKKYIKRYMGGDDIVSENLRYCLWIEDNQLQEALQIPFIAKRVEDCHKYRNGAGRDAKKAASRAHQFCYRVHQDKSAIIVPKTSSSTRNHLPVAFTDKNTVINNEAFAIYQADLYLFSVLSSTMHRVWLSAVGGKLGAGFRYSVKLVYNTFPFPKITEIQKEELSKLALEVISEIEKYPSVSKSDLYDDQMPSSLKEIFKKIDKAIDKCYRKNDFLNEGERLQYLLSLYSLMKDKK